MLTLGQPFYSGYGSRSTSTRSREIREKVPALLRLPARSRAHPRASCTPRCGRCHPGAPVLVDRSDENAVALAGSIELVALRSELPT